LRPRLTAAALAVLALAGCGSHGTSSGSSAASSSAKPTASPVVTAGLNSAEQQFASDMRTTFSFDSTVHDSDLADFGQQVCTAREGGISVAGEVPTAQGDWSNTSKGDGLQMITLAERDMCQAQYGRQTITYVVTGTPGADVTYGPAGSDFQGSVPMSVTKTLHSPQYYAIDAQLQGGGSVGCKLKVDGVTIASASASGGFNIADCEIDQDITTESWENTNS
jgi:hypothetical protein